uniref:Polypeptide N-acetylgalactosaminyltransferase n=2 Tax=Hirondellea gigas TaxID=1518452 RepID=A0A6A7GAY1_9CRUS
MGFLSILHPRRRGLYFRALCLVTFVGFMCLWLKSDSTDKGEADIAGRLVREVHKNSINDKVKNNPQPGIEAPVPGIISNNKLPNEQDQILNHNINDINLSPQFNSKPIKSEHRFEEEDQEWKKAMALFAVDERMVVQGLGDMGRAVHLSGADAVAVEEVMKVEAFNKILSDKISVNRSVPDSRDQLCTRLSYSSSLPSATVIIIFTNEAWSPLIRTIHSVLNRSPLQHLDEILLVDDYSDRVELGEKLDMYIKYRLPPGKVRLLRLKSRHGLIRARLAGANEAKGDVLIFLDSHCETNHQWMEPLLQRIKESSSAVLVPIIDVIDDKTLEYYAGNGRYFQVGGFTWSGHFTWIEVSPEEEKRRGSPVAPTRSPTMAGGLFAIDRNYFWKVGGYDQGMDVWGGENLEMSFRVWMCGGTLETMPCSRVGHIFRSFHPYTFPGNKDTHGLNTARLAEVWMDDYKRLFYMYRPELEKGEWGDVSERRALRKQLQCHDFRWYLDNIFPQKFVLDEQSYAYGRLRNNASTPELCLDTLQADEKKRYDMGMYNCHTFLASSQYMSLSHTGELRREEVCAEVQKSHSLHPSKVFMAKCRGEKEEQEWIMTKSGHLLHKSTNLCLDTVGLQSMATVSATECQPVASQQWWFDHYTIS